MMKAYTIFVVIVLAFYYLGGKVIKTKDPIHDVLEYAKTEKDPVWSPRLIYWIGTYQFQRDEYEKAQDTLTYLLIEYPTCQYAPVSLINLGTSAEQLNNWKMAKSAMQQYIDLFPKGEDAALARKRLDMYTYKHGEDIPPFPKKDEQQQ